ncbi:hypothetical protein B0H16DRAFT_1460102 [Mycena metata]|uniref:Uncharacterized protein n=1 Tax=Mycena metata TaxID=1033252 RepID=A0AAD7NAG1_9AGAR|nr:hypothetical protein B0H16DRAFT_1460102 [Mycena metata]
MMGSQLGCTITASHSGHLASAAHRRRAYYPATIFPHSPAALRLPRTLSPQETLRHIAQEPDLDLQIGFHMVNSGLYAHDRASPGVVYCVARVPTKILKGGRLTEAEFLAAADLKFGVTKDLPARRRAYNACEGNEDTHLWLFCVATRQHHRLEVPPGTTGLIQ